MILYYDRQGNPLGNDLSRAAWPSSDKRRVALSDVNGVQISTVFLGVNCQYRGGPPLIFESMVFVEGSTASAWDLWCDRYSTEAEALSGHAAICAAITEGITPEEFVTKREATK